MQFNATQLSEHVSMQQRINDCKRSMLSSAVQCHVKPFKSIISIRTRLEFFIFSLFSLLNLDFFLYLLHGSFLFCRQVHIHAQVKIKTIKIWAFITVYCLQTKWYLSVSDWHSICLYLCLGVVWNKPTAKLRILTCTLWNRNTNQIHISNSIQ